MLSQQSLRIFTRNTNLTHNKILARGHAIANLQRCPLGFGDKTQITVRNDANKTIFFVNNRKTRHTIVTAKLIKLFDGRIGTNSHRIFNHSRFGALHLTNMLRLFFNRKIAVKDANTTLTSHGNRHTSFSHSIHRCRKQRNTQGNFLRQPRRSVNSGWNDVSQLWEQKNVIVSKASQ